MAHPLFIDVVVVLDCCFMVIGESILRFLDARRSEESDIEEEHISLSKLVLRILLFLFFNIWMITFLLRVIKLRSREKLSTWIILQMYYTVQRLTREISFLFFRKISYFSIYTVTIFLTYKPATWYLVSSFMREIRREESEVQNPATTISKSVTSKNANAMSIYYIEIGYLATITTGILIIMATTELDLLKIATLSSYLAYKSLLTYILKLGIKEKNREKLKWWIFITYMNLLIQLVYTAITYMTAEVEDFTWIFEFSLFLYLGWALYIITSFKQRFEEDEEGGGGEASSDFRNEDLYGHSNANNSWIYAGIPMNMAFNSLHSANTSFHM